MQSFQDEYDGVTFVERWLQIDLTNTTEDSDECIDRNDSATLRNTIFIYGGIFLGCFLLFCFLRLRHPQTFAVRRGDNSFKARHATYLAGESYGYFSWIRAVFSVPDDDFLHECGMDALCLVRIQNFGLRMSLFTMLNAAWLIPLYYTAPSSNNTDCIEDKVVRLTIAHVPSGNPRLIASAIAAWIIFGYSMFAIWKELKWYIKYRHKFLSLPIPRNYSVFLRYLPEEYRSNTKIIQYFENLFHHSAVDTVGGRAVVVESNVAYKLPNLDQHVSERDSLLTKLEHAANVKQIKHETPTHKTKLIGGEKVESIPTWSDELKDKDEHLRKELERLRRLDDSNLLMYGNHPSRQDGIRIGAKVNDIEGGLRPNSSLSSSSSEEVIDTSLSSGLGNGNGNNHGDPNNDGANSDGNGHSNNNHNGMLGNLLPGGNDEEDGKALSAAFVNFHTLRATRMALQMQHHEDPHTMTPLEAPDEDFVIWQNVGTSHKVTQGGIWLSFTLTAAVLLFWTFVIAFASSLSSLEGLKDIGFIENILEAAPWLEPVLAQIAPFIVVLVQVLLRPILAAISNLERPIAGSMLETSLFTKLAWFMIIQNFFIVSLSGGVLAAYSEIIDSPTSIVELLATSLPGQSTFHIQILLTNIFITFSLELLRVLPVAMAKIRDIMGHNLTEKERAQPYMGMRQLNDPEAFPHAPFTSWNILYFMVLYVYSTIAPLTSIFLGLSFFIMGAAYRHQFVYIYPKKPDSGGKIHEVFLKLILVCIIVAELTILGLFGIKLSPVASGLMIPLLIITIAFVLYVRKEHFEAAAHLPGLHALRIDLQRSGADFTRSKYTQPSLKANPYAWPGNLESPYPGKSTDPMNGAGDAPDTGVGGKAGGGVGFAA